MKKAILAALLLIFAAAEAQNSHRTLPFDRREELNLDTLGIAGRGEGMPPQGLAFADGYIFALYHGGLCVVIDAADNTLAGEYMLAGAEGTHCNNASFGADRASEGSPFPLLYVSECNAPSRCFVIDADLAGSRLVQTIRYEGTGIDRFCDWCVDRENRHLYAFGRTPENGAVFKRFDLPAPDSAEVILTDGDVLWEHAYPEGFFRIPQGSCIDGGRIYCPTGNPRICECMIHVIDLADGEEVARCNIDDTGREPEGCFVRDGRLHVFFTGGCGAIYSYGIADESAE